MSEDPKDTSNKITADLSNNESELDSRHPRCWCWTSCFRRDLFAVWDCYRSCVHSSMIAQNLEGTLIVLLGSRVRFLRRLCYNRLMSLHNDTSDLDSERVNRKICGVDYVSIEHLVVWMQRRRDYPI